MVDGGIPIDAEFLGFCACFEEEVEIVEVVEAVTAVQGFSKTTAQLTIKNILRPNIPVVTDGVWIDGVWIDGVWIDGVWIDGVLLDDALIDGALIDDGLIDGAWFETAGVAVGFTINELGFGRTLWLAEVGCCNGAADCKHNMSIQLY